MFVEGQVHFRGMVITNDCNLKKPYFEYGYTPTVSLQNDMLNLFGRLEKCGQNRAEISSSVLHCFCFGFFSVKTFTSHL